MIPLSPTSILCEACAQLGSMTQATEPHGALLNRGSKQLSNGHSMEQLFRCGDCDTIWVRQVDKWGIEGAFRLASNTPATG